MLAFRAEHCQLTRSGFLFGNARLPLLASGSPFALRLVASQFTGGLASMGVYSTNIYLGYETLFGSPGAGPVILSSWGEGWGNDRLTARATGE